MMFPLFMFFFFFTSLQSFFHFVCGFELCVLGFPSSLKIKRFNTHVQVFIIVELDEGSRIDFNTLACLAPVYLVSKSDYLQQWKQIVNASHQRLRNTYFITDKGLVFLTHSYLWHAQNEPRLLCSIFKSYYSLKVKKYNIYIVKKYVPRLIMQMSKVLWKSGLVIKFIVINTCENQMRIEHSCNLD